MEKPKKLYGTVAILFLLIAALTGCDPGFTVTVRNDTNVPVVLSGRDYPGEKWKRLAPGQDVGVTRFDHIAEQYEKKGEPVNDVVATDPQGRSLHLALSMAELEAGEMKREGKLGNFVVVIRNGDFESLTPTAPK